MKMAAIQIAAGLSSRMVGPNKLLQDIGGKTLIQHTFSQLSDSGVDDLIVVTGRDAEQVQLSIVNCQLSIPTFVFNSNFEKGMTTSIQTGLKWVGDADAVMVCLSDMPELTTDLYNQMIEAFKEQGGRDKIMVPFKDKQKGNPVIFGADFFIQMAEHPEPNGCSGIVKHHPEQVIRFMTDSGAFIFDIDTPEALSAYKNRAH
jgi:molybdenum cofactor cytidylyltransferase